MVAVASAAPAAGAPLSLDHSNDPIFSPALVLVLHRALLDLRRMKLGYDEGGAGTEVGSSMVLQARVLV